LSKNNAKTLRARASGVYFVEYKNPGGRPERIRARGFAIFSAMSADVAYRRNVSGKKRDYRDGTRANVSRFNGKTKLKNIPDRESITDTASPRKRSRTRWTRETRRTATIDIIRTYCSRLYSVLGKAPRIGQFGPAVRGQKTVNGFRSTDAYTTAFACTAQLSGNHARKGRNGRKQCWTTVRAVVRSSACRYRYRPIR